MKKHKLQKYFSLLFKLATSMVVSICIFFFFGLFLERLFNLNGILVICGTFTGVLVGFYLVYKQLSVFLD